MEKFEFNPHEREARDSGTVKLWKYNRILIHTSVKLVTYYATTITTIAEHFNPHEREARDVLFHHHSTALFHFNPHEREARDCNPLNVVSVSQHFNPHEREARDRS